MDTGRGLEKTLVAAAGGPFQHGDWETPYPLPDRCDDSCVILEARYRPVCRAAMMDYVLNWIVQTMCTVAGGAPDAAAECFVWRGEGDDMATVAKTSRAARRVLSADFCSWLGFSPSLDARRSLKAEGRSSTRVEDALAHRVASTRDTQLGTSQKSNLR